MTATGEVSGRRWPYLLAAVGLFLVWSNSFVAASYLLGGEGREAQLDWLSLTVARFLPAAPLALLWCLLFRRAESVRLLRRYPLRLALCGLLGAPAYNLALYYGQQHGVPPPVASLTTALLPLFVLLLAALFLGEPLTRRRIAAFGVSFAGLALIALSKGSVGSASGYGLLLGVTALAPLAWSLYTIIAKPLMADASPLVWTFLGIGVGGFPLLLALPWLGGPIAVLSADGWAALLYLSIFCTLVGYAVWSWLLRHLPASSVGFTVFLNPPLTTVSKLVLASLFPAAFVFRLDPLEWVGGALALAGLGLATTGRRMATSSEPASLDRIDFTGREGEDE